MKSLRCCCLLALLLSLPGNRSVIAQPSPPASSPVTAIHCGRLLDVRSGELLARQIILITGNRITSVSPESATTLPANARMIDLSQLTCLPGLIDAHTHLVDGPPGNHTFNWARPLMRSGAQMAFEGAVNARATLDAGFTSVRDLGTYRAFVDVALRDAIERGTIPGPRMQTAGAYVTISGGAGALTGFAPDVELPLELRFGVADGPDQVRQRVREIIRGGAGVVKVLATGAILTLGSQPGAPEFTVEELRAAVDEASKAGLKVAAHAHSSAGAQNAIHAGVASIEHGTLLDDATLRLLKERGVFLMMDVFASWDFWPGGTPEGKPANYPAEFVEKEKISYASQVRVFRRAIELGVRIAFGTDAAVIPHGQNARLFQVYVKNGMRPLDALRAATLSNAELLGWADRVGAIEPGKLADIIAVRENPLEDITTLERVAFVMKDGKVFRLP
jgi:imidazolonepropionase-like amidohydrolase